MAIKIARYNTVWGPFAMKLRKYSVESVLVEIIPVNELIIYFIVHPPITE
jgi:hypothetical protein